MSGKVPSQEMESSSLKMSSSESYNEEEKIPEGDYSPSLNDRTIHSHYQTQQIAPYFVNSGKSILTPSFGLNSDTNH